MRPLLETRRTLGANIEFTTYCNLKCVYCAVQKPDYTWEHLDLGSIDAIVDGLQERRILEITVSGHGETTQVPDWHRHCDRMIERGCKLNIITNLSKELDPDEVQTFSRFNSILISVDSVDHRVFKAIRRGADLRTVLYNMGRITAAAQARGERGPRLGWTTVVNEANVLGLVEIVHFGLRQEVRFFSFCNVVIYPKTNDRFCRHIGEMALEQQALVPPVLDELERVLKASGVEYDITSGVRESVEAIRQGVALLTPQQKSQSLEHVVYRLDRTDQKGVTRDCIDPWNLAFVNSDGTVKPCFATPDNLGRLGPGTSLAQLLEGPVNRDYREGLLRGYLKEACRNCHCKGWTTTDALRGKVEAYLREHDAVDAPDVGFADLPYALADVATGWYWTDSEPGRGWAVEQRGAAIYLGGFLYDDDGAASWCAAALRRRTDGTFVGELLRYADGQTLSGAYRQPTGASVAKVVFHASTDSTASLQVFAADGTTSAIDLTRFRFGEVSCAAGFQTGWYWNPAEAGRACFVDVQGTQVYAALFSYRDDGRPGWYCVNASLQSGNNSFDGELREYVGGQSLLGPYRPARAVQPSSLGLFSFQGDGPRLATLTLAGGAKTTFRRFVFS